MCELRPPAPRALRADALAGVTVAAYLVPQVLAYSGLARMPPEAGLWAAFVALAVYFVLGSSPQLSVGPESTTALMTGAALAAITVPGESAQDTAALLALAVGAVCLIAAAGGLAFLADLLSKPVLVGYMAGIAGLMILSQVGRGTGADVPQAGLLTEVWWVVQHPSAIHGPTVVVCLATLTVLLVGNRVWPTGPVPLAGMLGATLAVTLAGLSEVGVAVVGDLDLSLPTLGLPAVPSLGSWALLTTALAIAVVGFTDNVLTARAFGDRHGDRIDARRELLALGAANVAAGVVHGFPVSSSGSRTAIIDAVGGRSRWSGLSTLVAAVVLVAALAPVLARFPEPALAAVVVYAGLRLVDVSEFVRIAGYRRTELLIALTTTVGVLVFGVLPGVLVAVTLSLGDVLRRVARPHDAVEGLVPELAGMHDVDDYDDAEVVPGLLVYRYDAPLFFANADNFLTRVRESVARYEPRWVLLNAEAMGEVDLTGADALEALRAELEKKGIVLALARLKQDPRDVLAPSGILERIGTEHIFHTLPTALEAYRATTSPD
ncbi:SulP family inorganic anion transporter [Nocardioides seonyuensis]|uniref:SulP family inorganic anion transporter n=1 Tax=Nocardioides seonyuensis TaxID=2518371 RepID=A0A4P7IC65_9ACTN|nr:SulP family inorganic anion transporter [Nocardioides seonyuensis]QBX54656.1 SulP family inorganic anion transporter [Nocardioides seonyuensis]